ncbi:lipopolysaccharide biosynthesis protein [Brumimicrobium glaciale]|uniref:Lipopolysaccharide biosynthesis protein n=1 Tax=Brumimicrobium glaciale TaxID=200475 RepID=A0A4Q4KPR9_9FLAO|nr:lipopolysaccharide biosynthesis protein [Brumimicrobium glaciale]RYM34524.1 lipopolysaccharide biosynthesis protein [Brumimicrobium glaciale]
MSLKKQAVSGAIWTFSQQFIVQFISFGVQIILARLLLPELFGLIAMLSVFVSIGQTLMDGGMTSSLIRTKNPDQLDYSTVFITNLMVSTFVYGLTFIAAPYIAEFYGQEILKNLLRIYALSFVILSLVAVHTAKLTKEMNFKIQMKLQIPAAVSGGIIGVTMAYSGYGVWSLVFGNIGQSMIYVVLNWVFIKWRPSLVFNKRRFKYHLNFGYKLTLSGLLDTIYNDSYRIVIGKFFSPASVGFFNQAENMRLFPVKQIFHAMGKVTYPLFSNIKNDVQLKSAYRITLKLVLFAVIPIMLILMIVANEFFMFLFGEKWLPAVPYFQVLAIASIIRPISSYNLNILKVKGRSDLLLKIESVQKVFGIIIIIIALPFGIMALVASLTFVTFVFTLSNMWFSGRLINYHLTEQIKDVSKLFIIGFFAAVVSYFTHQYLFSSINSGFLMMGIISLVFGIIYFGAIYLFEKNMVEIIKKLVEK